MAIHGTRKTKRSMKGKRLTAEERIALAKDCKHKRFRYRNCSTEIVCLDCGAVRGVKLGDQFGLEFTGTWEHKTP